MKKRSVKTVKKKFNLWSEKYLLGLTVRQFERLARCPFCEFLNEDRWWEPWPDCLVCYGRGRVPVKMVGDLLNSMEYRRILNKGNVDALKWSRKKRFDSRYSDLIKVNDKEIKTEE